MGGVNELAIEMGLGTFIYMPSFIKFDSAIQKLLGGIHVQRAK
jgi:hypothetical protein